MTRQKTFLRRLAVLAACLVGVGVLGRAAGTNEDLPPSRVIEGIVLPVPRAWPADVPGRDAVSAASERLDAATRTLLAQRDGTSAAQLATVSSTR